MTTSASKSSVLDPYPVLLNGLVVIAVVLLLMLSPIGFRYTWAQPNDVGVKLFYQAADGDDSPWSPYEFIGIIGSSPVQLNEVTLGDSFKWTLQAIVAPERLYDNLPMYGYELNKEQVTRIEDVYGEIAKRFGQYKVADEITNNNTTSSKFFASADWYVGIADQECGTSDLLVSVMATPLFYINVQQLALLQVEPNTVQVESNEELVRRCFMSSKPIQRAIDEEIPEPIKLWVSRKNWADSYNQGINDLLKASSRVSFSTGYNITIPNLVPSNGAGSFITP